MSVVGVVTAGRGIARQHLHDGRAEFTAATGHELYCGSLNLRLSMPILLQNDRALAVDCGKRLLWPAELNGTQVWIYRFWDQPLHFFEILAPFHIRYRYGLTDGDEVRVTVNCADVQPLDWKRSLLWWILWRFREPWAYTNDFYFQGTRALAGDLGLTQRAGVDSVALSLSRFGRLVATRLRTKLFRSP